jgi:hypothetical protein
LANVLFQAKEFRKNSALPSAKTTDRTAPEKMENEIGDGTWLVLNVLDQTRFTAVR